MGVCVGGPRAQGQGGVVSTCPPAFCWPDLGCTAPAAIRGVGKRLPLVLCCNSAGPAVTGAARVLLPQIGGEYGGRDRSVLTARVPDPRSLGTGLPYSAESKQALRFPTPITQPKH